MADDWTAIVCSRGQGCRPVRVPRTEPAPEWEADRHRHEVAYWAAHLNELVSFLPSMRHRRGIDRAGRLVADVIEHLRDTAGEDEAVFARERLMDRWRGQGGRV